MTTTTVPSDTGIVSASIRVYELRHLGQRDGAKE
jgi:hypothetical protein